MMLIIMEKDPSILLVFPKPYLKITKEGDMMVNIQKIHF